MNNDEGSYLSAYLTGERAGYNAALRDAIQAVKAAMPEEDEGWEKSIAVAWMRHAVAAIEALGGER